MSREKFLDAVPGGPRFVVLETIGSLALGPEENQALLLPNRVDSCHRKWRGPRMVGRKNMFQRASKILEKHRKRLLKIRGVQGLAVSTGAQHRAGAGVCLVVYVDGKVDRNSLPDEIEGLPVHTIP